MKALLTFGRSTATHLAATGPLSEGQVGVQHHVSMVAVGELRGLPSTPFSQIEFQRAPDLMREEVRLGLQKRRLVLVNIITVAHRLRPRPS